MRSTRELSYMEITDGIYQGWGWEEFDEKYKISKTRLKRHIRNSLGLEDNRAQKLIRCIYLNSKRKQKYSKDTTTKNPKDLESLPFSERLDNLKIQETELSSTVINLELAHKEVVNQQRDNMMRLRKLRKEIDEIEERLCEKNKVFEGIVRENEQLTASMQRLSEVRKERGAELDAIRREIANLETITICVLADGVIRPFEDINIVLDDTGSEELFTQLVTRDECQELRAKDIRIMARLLCIWQNLGMNVEVISEIDGIEQVFDSLIEPTIE